MQLVLKLFVIQCLLKEVLLLIMTSSIDLSPLVCPVTSCRASYKGKSTVYTLNVYFFATNYFTLPLFFVFLSETCNHVLKWLSYTAQETTNDLTANL